MARLNFKSLNFTPTPGAAGHRLAAFVATSVNGIEPAAEEVYTGAKVEVGNDGVVDKAEVEGLGGANVEGKFDLYLWAYDAAGNESDFAVKRDVPLDLVVPAAPSWL